MPTSSFSANLTTCQELLREIQEELSIRGSRFIAEDLDRINNTLHRLQQQHDAAIDQLQRSNIAFRSKYIEEKDALEQARRTNNLQENKIRSRNETIEDQSVMIKRLKMALEASKQAEDASFQRGYLAAQGQIRNLEAQKQSLTQSIVQRDLKMQSLKKDVEQAQSDFNATATKVYQQGVADGRKQEQSRTIDILARERLLKELNLTNTAGYTLHPNLEAAIKSGQADAVAAMLNLQRTPVRAPALHLAALFGDEAIAALLVEAGADVDESCQASSEKNSSHLYGVTPMHLAVGAQHEGMIRCLTRHGAHFSFGSAPAGKKATATPAYWLISERWLRLSGKAESKDVLRILRTMKACHWDFESAVDRAGDNLKTVAWKNLQSRPRLQRDVMDFLDGMVI